LIFWAFARFVGMSLRPHFFRLSVGTRDSQRLSSAFLASQVGARAPPAMGNHTPVDGNLQEI
jgi:hypothetical protein